MIWWSTEYTQVCIFCQEAISIFLIVPITPGYTSLARLWCRTCCICTDNPREVSLPCRALNLLGRHVHSWRTGNRKRPSIMVICPKFSSRWLYAKQYSFRIISFTISEYRSILSIGLSKGMAWGVFKEKSASFNVYLEWEDNSISIEYLDSIFLDDGLKYCKVP